MGDDEGNANDSNDTTSTVSKPANNPYIKNKRSVTYEEVLAIECNTRVGAHCFRDNHHARLVVNLNTTYYIMSRRYICHECKQVNKESKANLKAIAEQQGINMTIPEEDQNERSYTFMGYDKRVLPLFKYNRGETEFPAYFTWRAGLDKTIINMIRPLFDGGFRPERLSDMLLELHSKEYTMQCIKHENMIRET